MALTEACAILKALVADQEPTDEDKRPSLARRALCRLQEEILEAWKTRDEAMALAREMTFDGGI
jgi:hypothetical protein